MKHKNLIGLLFVVALMLLFSFNWKFSNETVVFYGFANNKELNINLEHPCQVKELYVEPGQRVYPGDVLMEVTRSGIAMTQSDINHDIMGLQSQNQLWESGLKNSIRTLEAQKTEKRNELESAIKKLASEMSINASLIKGIESIDQIKDNNGNDPLRIELNGLKRELRLSMQTFNSEISKLEKELNSPDNPLLIEIEKLSDNLNFVKEEEKNLKVTAQEDGLVGSILCKVGENIQAFSPFLTVYEETPNHVKGYVLESLILKVNINDTLLIQSVSHTEETIKGIVVAMGSRIVEIPSRLRKNPTFTTYGREVEIEIPMENSFLQNEKVILKKRTENDNKVIMPNRDYDVQ